MSTLDPTVARVLDHRPTTDPDSGDEDALIAALESSQEETALRERRLQQLHAELSRAKTLKQQPGHGQYQEIKDEKELLTITTSTPLCVVHFMKPDFNRCRIMDQKLAVLAEKHLDTRFVSINVENAPFLVVKLGIQVLPCVISFKKAVSVDQILGFEGIGVKPDSFTVGELEARLAGSADDGDEKDNLEMTALIAKRRLSVESTGQSHANIDWTKGQSDLGLRLLANGSDTTMKTSYGADHTVDVKYFVLGYSPRSTHARLLATAGAGTMLDAFIPQITLYGAAESS
ncbi:hypothetical protein LTR29_008140 [Friedmanniomyces endolithicus]|nr:hypothetical protein LTR29_008140 [Friedmanniomyces endolithicus]